LHTFERTAPANTTADSSHNMTDPVAPPLTGDNDGAMFTTIDIDIELRTFDDELTTVQAFLNDRDAYEGNGLYEDDSSDDSSDGLAKDEDENTTAGDQAQSDDEDVVMDEATRVQRTLLRESLGHFNVSSQEDVVMTDKE